VLVAAAYLVVALVVLRGVLPAPGRLLPYPALLDWTSSAKTDLARLDHRDQSMVVSVVTRNAAILTTAPWRLFSGFGQCYPMPRSYTLGEHMFGTSLLAAVPYLLTHDPIVSFNAALVLTLWIPALTMFVLSLHFTRSVPAAFVAGMLFMLVPGRIVDPSHPYVHGDLWTPLVLLFLHRLFVHERWSDALLFALFMSLEVFESLYPLLACSLMVVVYGGWLAVRHWRRLLALLPKVAVAAALVLLSAWAVLGPYLETRDTWGLLEGRTSLLLRLRDYGWGSIYFPGAMILGLAGLGLVDRARRWRPVNGEDPRLVIFAAGFVVLWSATSGLPIPFSRLWVPSPIAMLKPYLPGLNAVRALNAIAIGASLAWAFLGGYGILFLTERRRRGRAIAVAAAPTALTLTCLYWGRIAKPMFTVWSFKLVPWAASAPAQDVELLRRSGDGAVLDIPYPQMDTPASVHLARHLLLNAYSPRATAACYNSFVSPVQTQIAQLGAELPDRAASDALVALGFGTVIIDKALVDPGTLQSFFDGLANLDNAERLHAIGKTGRLLAYRLASSTPVRRDYEMLAGDGAPGGPPAPVVMGDHVPLDVTFTNHGHEIFRMPDPIAPADVVVTWHNAAGRVVKQSTARGLLPMALAPRASRSVTLTVATPYVPGRYVVTVARAAAPDTVLSTRLVDLSPTGKT
jgi:hypothetical protein